MKILLVGAGVIGTVYGANLAAAGDAGPSLLMGHERRKWPRMV